MVVLLGCGFIWCSRSITMARIEAFLQATYLAEYSRGAVPMSSPPTIDAIARWFSTIVISSGGVAAFLYFLLKKTLEKTVDSRFDARLEQVKHALQLEQQKMSIVYEQQ